MADFYSQLGWLAISHDTPKTTISDLAFDKPEAFISKTAWTGSFNRGSLQYQPNHVYANPTPTEFQLYFHAEKSKGRTAEDIYRNNSFMVKTIAYTAPPPVKPTPNFTVAAVITALPTTYTWTVPFRSGLTDKQKDSITNLLTNRTNSNQVLNETDARNYAFAVGVTNWTRFVGLAPSEVAKVPTAQLLNKLLTATVATTVTTHKTTSPPDLLPLLPVTTDTATKSTTPANAAADWRKEEEKVGAALNAAAEKYPFIDKIFDHTVLTGAAIGILSGVIIAGAVVAGGGAIVCGAICGPTGSAIVLVGGNAVNQGKEAILKNGYYEVNGFKFTEYYYNRLWSTGRAGPSLVAQEVVAGAKSIVTDKIPGFYKYTIPGWEVIWNPITKVVAHMVQLN